MSLLPTTYALASSLRSSASSLSSLVPLSKSVPRPGVTLHLEAEAFLQCCAECACMVVLSPTRQRVAYSKYAEETEESSHALPASLFLTSHMLFATVPFKIRVYRTSVMFCFICFFLSKMCDVFSVLPGGTSGILQVQVQVAACRFRLGKQMMLKYGRNMKKGSRAHIEVFQS